MANLIDFNDASGKFYIRPHLFAKRNLSQGATMSPCSHSAILGTEKSNFFRMLDGFTNLLGGSGPSPRGYLLHHCAHSEGGMVQMYSAGTGGGMTNLSDILWTG